MADLAEIVAATDRHLAGRRVRRPEYEAESKALGYLAQVMAQNPARVLPSLCEQVLTVCGAESAGISLLANEHSDEFVWPAIAGKWAEFEGGGMPRSASPCGMVIRANRSLLFHDVEKQFPAAAGALPLIGEVLLAPFRVDNQPIGTVWAIMHSDAKRFDREDQRLLESLAHFAACAYKMADAVEAANKTREELKFVNLELAHRLKNILAVISAISSTSLRTVTPRADVIAFQARLQALAQAQDILVTRAQGEADIGTLAEAVVSKLCDHDRVELSGPPLALGPTATLTFSLILHELVTNALKYGALSSPAGKVYFSWAIIDDGERRIVARWSERGGPVVVQPSKRGFGTRLISMGILGRGDAKVHFKAEGLEVEFSAPLRALAEASATRTRIYGGAHSPDGA
jgi:two-component sensor histidine kinase